MSGTADKRTRKVAGKPAPDAIASRDSFGDDTARRYAYQWTYAAVLGCALLDAASDIREVFCEHHEDILLKHSSGHFTGIQVKTTERGDALWKAGDPEVISALSRFVELDVDFPNKFRGFVIATNHPFFKDRESGACLPFLLDAARVGQNASLPKALDRFVAKIARGRGVDPAVVRECLAKCHCDDALPKIAQIESALVNTVVEVWPEVREIPLLSVRTAARALVSECQRASSLSHEQTLPAYLSATRGAPIEELRRRIEAKRFDRGRVEQVLKTNLKFPVLLAGKKANRDRAAQEGTSLLEMKLALGGLSGTSVNSAKDLRDKADYQAFEWIAKVGEDSALRRRDHVRSLVLRDCADAFESARRTDRPFGYDMLLGFRRGLARRREGGGADLFDCLDEHLEGHAFDLTNECKVWWSEDPPQRKG